MLLVLVVNWCRWQTKWNISSAVTQSTVIRWPFWLRRTTQSATVLMTIASIIDNFSTMFYGLGSSGSSTYRSAQLLITCLIAGFSEAQLWCRPSHSCCYQLLIGTTVLCGTWNFEPSHGIYPFQWNSYIFVEFCGIYYWRYKYAIFWSISGSHR